jgi:alpha-ketoglutarate-dependent taurine dioxygenase
MVWFNQAHLFHVSALEPTVRQYLLAEFKEQDLPRNAFYGDGTSIEEPLLDEIRQAYNDEMVTFAWQQADILLLDNMLAAHARESFAGPRRILVGMSETFQNEHL